MPSVAPTCPSCRAPLAGAAESPAACPRCGVAIPGAEATATIESTRVAEPASEPGGADEFEQGLLRLAGGAASAGVAPREASSSDALGGLGSTGGSFPFLAPPLAPGEIGRLGPYRVLELLGQGGMGAVFRAEDPALGRQVALKVMLPELARSSSAKARFVREARSQAQVDHDHVAVIHHVGEHAGVPFLIMPLLKGRTLAAALASGPRLSVGEAVRVAREMAEGLAAAHEKRLVHRDIKPGNVWLEGARGRVKILDFGLARAASGAETELAPLTHTGTVVGTPAYMSPEQARGEKLDPRSDLFSLGSVLYQMLTGRAPFGGGSVTAVLLAVVGDAPRRPGELNPEVPAALDDLVMRLLAKDPAGRPASAAAVAADLRVIEAAAGATIPDAIPLGDASASQPVLYPLQPPAPAARPEDAFADLGADPSAAVPEPPREQPAGRGRTRLLVGAILILVAVAGASVAYRSLSRPDQTANREGEKPDAPPKQPPKTNDGKKPVSQPARDRAAAELVLGLGGEALIEGWTEPFKSAADLPRDPFVLTGVHFSQSPVGDAVLSELPKLPSLVSITLHECPNLTDASLGHFRECKNVAHLNLQGSPRFTDDGLKHFQGVRSLRTLYLGGPQVSNAGLALLKDSKELTVLDLAGCGAVDDEGLAHFKDCKSLKILRLLGTAATDAVLADFADCRQLAWLSLDGRQVTDAGLARLKSYEALTRLDLEGDALTDDGLANVNDLKPLKDLALAHAPRITDAGVARLTVAPRLTRFVLNDCPKVTDAGLAPFREAKSLTYLALASCPKVTDEGLRPFEGCVGLIYADLTNSGVTDAGVERFARALPRCRIKRGTKVIEPRK
jgi:serine/threonine protein kinase